MSESPNHYMSPEEFLANAKPTTVFQDAVRN